MKRQATFDSGGPAKKSCSQLDQEDTQATEVTDTSSLIEESTGNPTYRTYFSYEKNASGEKIGVCKTCPDRATSKVIKMKNGNTSGLKYHLKRYHPAVYQKLFGSNSADEKKSTTNSSSQKLMNTYTQVSNTNYA